MTMGQEQKTSFEALYEITKSINSILEPVVLLEKILESAMAHLNAERGSVLLKNESKKLGFSVVASKNFGPEHAGDKFAASSSVIQQVMTSGSPVLTFDALTDERFESSRSIVTQQILSIICIPLRASEKISGVVYLDSSVSRKAFTEESLKFLTVFGHLAAIAIENAQRYASLRDENERLRNQVDVTRLFTTMVGKSEPWKKALGIIKRVLDVDVAVLITGESGTGKELVARAIHDSGLRSGKAFVSVNCSAIPEQLIESELFGYVKGAFTGASSDKKGLVEVAEGGTLFLDEIADLPLLLQPKILRLLQEKEYRRVGDTKNRAADIRIVATTNRDMREEVKNGRVREDLYFRLNVVEIHLPPLRERKEDIPLLATHFVRRAADTYKRAVDTIHSDAMQMLLANHWSGNVREFQNVIERAVVLCTGTQLTKEDFIFDASDRETILRSATTLEDFERQVIEATLAEMGGNRTRTAEKLGVSLRWLQYRLKEWSNE